MAKSLRVVFDGEVLRPEEPVDLKPNARYVVIVEREEERKEKGQEGAYPLTEIGKFAIDMGITDFSTRHSWYAHGRLDNNGSGS